MKMIPFVWLLVSVSIVLSGNSTALYYWIGSIVLFLIFTILPLPNPEDALRKRETLAFHMTVFPFLAKDPEIVQNFREVDDMVNSSKFWSSMNIIFFLATYAALIYAVYLAWSSIYVSWFG